jgi:hypothetical protein
MSGRFEYGARFELLRQKVEGDVVTYQGNVGLPEGRRAEFSLTFKGDEAELSIEPISQAEEFEEWMGDHLRAMATTMAKKARRSGTWPRRLSTWKTKV